MKHIIWLASYPKSGNTWVRMFLESYLYQQGGRVDINNLEIGRLRPLLERNLFNQFLGFDSADLNLEETNLYRRHYITAFGKSLSKDVIVKTHAANLKVTENQFLIPAEVTKLGIYVVRNPLDVVSSLANHFSETIDQSVYRLNSSAFLNYKDMRVQQSTIANPQLKSWSEHFTSWSQEKKFNLLIVKYEDLIENPHKTFKSIIENIDTEVDETRLLSAIKNSDFKTLKKQEEQKGFKEAPLRVNSFFRRGKAQGWQEDLNSSQINSIVQNHGEIMDKLGYLP